MSRSLNKAQLIGHIGADAELKFTPTGIARTSFSVATSRRWKDKASGEWKEEADWHRCVLWDSEPVSKFLTRGQHVYVEGALRTRKYEKDGQTHYATEITVFELILIGARREGAAGDEEPVSKPRRVQGVPAAPPADEFQQLGITDDDVPF